MGPIRRLAFVAVARSILCPVFAWAECLYCDEWRAFSGDPYFHNSTAALTESTITLPSCEPVGYRIVRTAPSRQFGDVCTDNFFELDHIPTCKRIPETMLKPFVLVTACLRTNVGNEELQIDLRQQPMHADGSGPGFYGASWRFIRKSYDPCSSGGGHGQWMCSKNALEDAEERLERITKARKIPGHREWILARDRKCSRKDHVFSESWTYRNEEQCKLRLTEARIAALKKSGRSPKGK